MSLAHSHEDLSTADASVKLRVRNTEPRPRSLARADTLPDYRTLKASKPSGNAKPQEPKFLAPRRTGFPIRVGGHAHAKPWSGSCMPGKRENPTAATSHHRTWISDGALADRVGKWNSSRLQHFHQEQDKALFKLKPADEMFATKSNMKYWTHLEGEGTKPGGQHKIDTNPPRQTGLHLKGGLYVGKYAENIKHAQLYNITGFRHNGGEGKRQDLHKDKRRPFDNRLKDDIIQVTHEADVEIAQTNYSIFRPANTLSCPQLGADFVHR